MPGLEEARTEVVKTDIVVIGGGIAGCNAAIKAKESGLDVVLVDKGSLGRSGLSPCMSGVLAYFDPEKDDHDEWFKECIEVGQWLNDQKCLEGMIFETTERIRAMDSWGVKFQKDRSGEFIRRRTLGQNFWRVLMVHGGLQLMLALRGEVLRRGIRVVERVMATDLLTLDGELPTGSSIAGVVGFDVRTGKFFVFSAKAVIIVTGGTFAVLVRCVYPILSGDGKAIAFRAGAEIRNADLKHHGIRLRDFVGPIGPGEHILASEGFHLLNANGDRFMEKWDPQQMERASRLVVSMAVASEEREGRGPVYVDATHLSDTSHNRIEKAIPMVIKNLDAVGLSFRNDRIPYTSEMQDVCCGGIRVNREGRTTLPGLYSAGDASDHGDAGVNTHISPGMGSAIVGHRAGKAATEYAAEIEAPTINEHQVRFLRREVFAPLEHESGLKHDEVREHCKSILERGLVGPFKSERGLKEAMAAAQEIREKEIPRLVARDYHELARSIGVGNELHWIELLARCSLERTESRGGHYREDYPQRDDRNWLKWVIAKRQDDGVKTWLEPIPFQEYRLKPKFPN